LFATVCYRADFNGKNQSKTGDFRDLLLWVYSLGLSVSVNEKNSLLAKNLQRESICTLPQKNNPAAKDLKNMNNYSHFV